jgi:hypothetical protein
MTSIRSIILDAVNIEDNRHDNATIPELLELLLSLCDDFNHLKLIIGIYYRKYHKYTDFDA